MTYDRDVHIATYDARLIFHITLPDWQIGFVQLDHDCRTEENFAVYCVHVRDILDAVRRVRSHSQLYLQHQIRRIDEVVVDLPIEDRDRLRCGVLTDILARATGLASQDDLRGVQQILEKIETGVYEASRLWDDGAKSLSAAFRLE